MHRRKVDSVEVYKAKLAFSGVFKKLIIDANLEFIKSVIDNNISYFNLDNTIDSTSNLKIEKFIYDKLDSMVLRLRRENAKFSNKDLFSLIFDLRDYYFNRSAKDDISVNLANTRNNILADIVEKISNRKEVRNLQALGQSNYILDCFKKQDTIFNSSLDIVNTVFLDKGDFYSKVNEHISFLLQSSLLYLKTMGVNLGDMYRLASEGLCVEFKDDGVYVYESRKKAILYSLVVSNKDTFDKELCDIAYDCGFDMVSLRGDYQIYQNNKGYIVVIPVGYEVSKNLYAKLKGYMYDISSIS